MTGCAEYPKCQPGSRRENFTCIACDYGWYCDGSITPHDCFKVDNLISATQCNGSHILKCNDGMMLNKTEGVCQVCPKFENGTIVPYCNGVAMVQCYRGAINKTKVLQIGEGLDFTCQSCPIDALCDGVDVIRCELRWKISDSRKSCERCGGSEVCDGSEAKSCGDIEGASSCKDGLVTECKKNYKPTDDGSACKINKA